LKKGDIIPKDSGARAPKQQRSRETQASILEAALAVFADRGYDGASMRLVAERAGVGHAVVVYHFPTKEDLWVATVEAGLARFMDRLLPNLEALEGLDPAVRLSLIFRDFTVFAAENPELLPIMVDANRRGRPALTRVIEDKLRPTYERLRELLVGAQRAGVMPAGDPALLYYAMVAVATTLFSLRREFEALSGRDPLDPDVVEAQANLLVRLFFPGL
jgi:AcrR family transcriptional regulator